MVGVMVIDGMVDGVVDVVLVEEVEDTVLVTRIPGVRHVAAVPDVAVRTCPDVGALALFTSMVVVAENSDLAVILLLLAVNVLDVRV